MTRLSPERLDALETTTRDSGWLRQDTILALISRIRELEDALRPFASAAEVDVHGWQRPWRGLTLAEIKNAARVLRAEQ